MRDAQPRRHFLMSIPDATSGVTLLVLKVPHESVF